MTPPAQTPAIATADELAHRAAAVPFWWHSVDLGRGVVTNGYKKPETLRAEWNAMCLPDLQGKSVLDVGAWDGYFSFAAEEAGAGRVVALDHFVWSVDRAAVDRYTAECRREGKTPLPADQLSPPMWQPDALPGRRGFDLAREARGSKVEPVVGDLMADGAERVGSFDVVFYLGVLYHMRHPLLALERVASVTNELAVIETAARVFIGQGDAPVCEFFETTELADDPTNWWTYSHTALPRLCRAAGFRDARIVSDTPQLKPWYRRRFWQGTPRFLDCRAVVHAWK